MDSVFLRVLLHIYRNTAECSIGIPLEACPAHVSSRMPYTPHSLIRGWPRHEFLTSIRHKAHRNKCYELTSTTFAHTTGLLSQKYRHEDTIPNTGDQLQPHNEVVHAASRGHRTTTTAQLCHIRTAHCCVESCKVTATMQPRLACKPHAAKPHSHTCLSFRGCSHTIQRLAAHLKHVVNNRRGRTALSV
jgi:hypothetical protein